MTIDTRLNPVDGRTDINPGTGWTALVTPTRILGGYDVRLIDSQISAITNLSSQLENILQSLLIVQRNVLNIPDIKNAQNQEVILTSEIIDLLSSIRTQSVMSSEQSDNILETGTQTVQGIRSLLSKVSEIGLQNAEVIDYLQNLVSLTNNIRSNNATNVFETVVDLVANKECCQALPPSTKSLRFKSRKDLNGNTHDIFFSLSGQRPNGKTGQILYAPAEFVQNGLFFVREHLHIASPVNNQVEIQAYY